MFPALIGAVFMAMGFWLFLGDPATDPQGRYLGETVHAVLEWIAGLRPFSTILAFVFGVAAFMMMKKR